MTSHYQYRANFSDIDRRTILRHMEVATAFWNYMVSVMRESTDRYMHSEGSEASLSCLQNDFKEMYQKTILSDNLDEAVEYGVPEEWLPYLTAFRSAPKFILEKRMSDIIQAYVRAFNEQRRVHTSLSRKPASIPSRKTSRSKQSFRIPDEHFLIQTGIGQESAVILVPELDNLKIHVPAFKKIPLDKIQSVTLSHNPAIVDDRLGPPQEKELMVTIWMTRPEAYRN